MKKISITTTRFILVVSIAGIAHADHWRGLYTGVDIGLVFIKTELKSQQLGFTNPSGHCNNTSHFFTLTPGVQLGYMFPLPNDMVASIEANVTVNTNQDYALTCHCPFNPDVSDHFSFKNQMQSSIKGRVGRPFSWNTNRFLPYLTVGPSFAHVGLTYKNEGGDQYSKNNTHVGWLIGTGIEWAFRENWSLRAEYNYRDDGNPIELTLPSVYGLVDPNGKGRVDLSSNSISLALDYWI